MKKAIVVLVVAVMSLVGLCWQGIAQTIIFSVDSASPSIPTVGAEDILGPGPIAGPPSVVIPGMVPFPVGLGLVPGDDVNSMSYWQIRNGPIYFSVDRAAVGVSGPAPDVFSEALVGQAAGDIYRSYGGGVNTLWRNQDVLGEIPPIPAGVAVGPPIDDLNALEFPMFMPPTIAGLYYTLAPGSPTLALIGAGTDDLLTTSPIGPVVAFPAPILGLSLFGPGDVVDALMISLGAGIPPGAYFSLAPGSPTLAFIPGASPGGGDVLFSPMTGAPPVIFASAASLGLAPIDNLNALSASTTNGVPEPSSVLLWGLGLLCLLTYRRFKG